MFLVEHCVPLMWKGAMAFGSGWTLVFFGSIYCLHAADSGDERSGIKGTLGMFLGLALLVGGKVAFLLGVLGCILSVFAKGT